MFAELWDGRCMEDLAPFLGGEEPAENIPPGLKRLIVFCFLRSIWFDLANPEESHARACLPELFGISEFATDDEIRDALIAMATEEGLTPREMRMLEQSWTVESEVKKDFRENGHNGDQDGGD
jgi:hypothetical protein